MIAASLHDWLVFGHIVAAMVWLGGAVLLLALAIVTVRGDDPVAQARFVRNLRVLGPAVLAPAMIGVVGFGVWLVLDSPNWDFGQAWVQVALSLFALAFVAGAANQSRAAIGAERAIERGDVAAARRQLVRWSWGYAAIVLLLVAITWDMVFKPGL